MINLSAKSLTFFKIPKLLSFTYSFLNYLNAICKYIRNKTYIHQSFAIAKDWCRCWMCLDVSFPRRILDAFQHKMLETFVTLFFTQTRTFPPKKGDPPQAELSPPRQPQGKNMLLIHTTYRGIQPIFRLHFPAIELRLCVQTQQ